MNKFNPGRLDKRISIKEYDNTTDKMGQEVPALKEIKSCWADVKDIRGNKYYDNKKIIAEITHFIYIRYTTIHISQQMYIKDGSKIYEIISCIPIGEDKVVMEIQAIERDAH